jgi:hypothetical protein
LIFGDSWPSGVELRFDQGEKPFGHLLAESMGAKLGHFPVPGTGVPHLILQLQQAIERYTVLDATALFCITDISRSIYFESSQWKEIHIHNSDITSRNFYKHLYSEELAKFWMNCYVLALQRMCQHHNIKDHYISCWNELDLYLPGIDKIKFYQQGKISMADILGCRCPGSSKSMSIDRSHAMIFPNECHPNQLGHQIIANHLYEWINNI